MSTPPGSAEALRLLQQGDVAAALEASRRAIAAQPGDARAHLAAGLALRFLGRNAESHAALEQAARLAPQDYAVALELGNALQLAGREGEALACFERACALRPGFAPAVHARGLALHRLRRTAEAEPYLAAAAQAQPQEARRVLDHAKALVDLRRWDEARAQYARALALAPRAAAGYVEYGRLCVARADYDEAARAFEAACALEPARIEWPMYLAQVELLRGHWARAWPRYRLREQRLRFEEQRAALAIPYRPPALAELRGQSLTLVREQGLGDELFFLRFAPALRAAGAKLHYVGDARLLPLLARTGLFEALRDIERQAVPRDATVMPSGDLPEVVAPDAPFAPPLAIAPLEDASRRMRERLEAAGPRPWIVLTWRSGTPRESNAEALSKEVELEVLAAAVAAVPGTVFALQREPRAGEIDTLARALARPVHDLAAEAGELEESLAIVALADRHVGVSNTNMHLAASAGATADVLVPFPPEWRWRSAGDSPWFPGFRIHRQDRDGRWSIAL